MSALKRKLFSSVAAFQLSQCSPNSSNDVQRSRDHGPGSLTLTMSPAWGSARAAAAGQPGHRSAIGVWSPSTRPQVLTHSNSVSHFTESLHFHFHFHLKESSLTAFHLSSRAIFGSDVSFYSTRSETKGYCSVKTRKTSIS